MDNNVLVARFGSLGVILALLVLIVAIVLIVSGGLELWPAGAAFIALSLAVMLR